MKPVRLGLCRSLKLEERKKVVVAEFSQKQRSQLHALIVGSPGSGKSKCLEGIIRQDIENRQGLCIVDIHGTLYQSVKRWCAFNSFYTRPIVLLDPSSGKFVKGFNPFRKREGVATDVQVGGMVEALIRVWGGASTNETPTLDRVLRLLFTVMVERNMSLAEAFQLIDFDNQAMRADVIATLTEPAVKAAWNNLQSLKNSREWHAEVLSAENRLFRLVSSPVIQRFMGVMDDEFNIDCRKIMDGGQVLLVNLKESTHLTGDNARAFAALLINDLFKTAIMFRDGDETGVKPIPFYLYLDEWQNFVTPDISKILAQARKFGLLLVLANQDLSQISECFTPQFVNTLMTCCQIKMCFGGLNREDAKRMASEMLVDVIDLKEVKYQTEVTKYEPVLVREKVFGESDMSGFSTGASFDVVQMAFNLPFIPSTASKNKGKAKSVSDIPMMKPKPYKEVTGVTMYTLEEQLWRWGDRLMNQPQRNFVLRIPGKPTMQALAEIVEERFVTPEVVAAYEKQISLMIGAKSPSEVDEMLRGRRAQQEAPPPAAKGRAKKKPSPKKDDMSDFLE